MKIRNQIVEGAEVEAQPAADESVDAVAAPAEEESTGDDDSGTEE